jgi:hypothetical protein
LEEDGGFTHDFVRDEVFISARASKRLCRTLGSLLFIGIIGLLDPRELNVARKLATLIATSGVSVSMTGGSDSGSGSGS